MVEERRNMPVAKNREEKESGSETDEKMHSTTVEREIVLRFFEK